MGYIYSAICYSIDISRFHPIHNFYNNTYHSFKYYLWLCVFTSSYIPKLDKKYIINNIIDNIPFRNDKSYNFSLSSSCIKIKVTLEIEYKINKYSFAVQLDPI